MLEPPLPMTTSNQTLLSGTGRCCCICWRKRTCGQPLRRKLFSKCLSTEAYTDSPHRFRPLPLLVRHSICTSVMESLTRRDFSATTERRRPCCWCWWTGGSGRCSWCCRCCRPWKPPNDGRTSSGEFVRIWAATDLNLTITCVRFTACSAKPRLDSTSSATAWRQQPATGAVDQPEPGSSLPIAGG